MKLTPGLLLLCSALSSAVAQDFKPVPADRIQGRRLTDKASSFSVDGPEGWTWSVAEDATGRMYACRETNSTRLFLVMALAPKPGEKTSVESLMENVVHSVEAAGLKIENLKKTPSDRPLPGSYRIAATVVGPGDFKKELRAHVGIGERLYSLQAVVEGAEDEALFDAFVSSFRRTESRTPAPRAKRPRASSLSPYARQPALS